MTDRTGMEAVDPTGIMVKQIRLFIRFLMEIQEK